jgi:SAM-dependent methyltransferase
MEVTLEATADGASGEVLEVAAAEGIHACSLNARGLDTFVLEPSPAMLARARARQIATKTSVPLVRAVAEAAPFRDAAFDRVLCDSALDHLADPERAIAEMARITSPSGRLVLTCGNYGGVTVRASRLLYRIVRRLGLVSGERERHFFWDTPVPWEHTFECTLENVSAMCAPYLELDRAIGVSLGCRFPGWAWLLTRWPALRVVLPWLDRVATRHPGLADFMVLVWRPKPRTQWPAPDELRVRPTNPVYQRQARGESQYWGQVDLNAVFGSAIDATRELHNERLTERPDRSWVDDLVARGPFGTAAALGCDLDLEQRWLDARGSSILDVYDLSPAAIAKVRMQLGALASRARFISADLNFVQLPEDAYDVIWAGDCLPASRISSISSPRWRVRSGRGACSPSRATSARRACSSTPNGWRARTRCSRRCRWRSGG